MISHKRVLLFCQVLFCSMILNQVAAQNGKFDARIAVKAFDCTANSVVLQVQIKASSTAHTFMLGDANYRFTYDPRQINHPVIISQDNFSSQSPALDKNYLAQNLSGSTEGVTKAILSINSMYSGSENNARLVDTAWLDVCCVKFDIVDNAKCLNIKWNDASTFPSTGMNEVIIKTPSPFDYTMANVVSNNVFIGIDGCFPTACDNKAPIVERKPLTVDEDGSVTACLKIKDFNLSDTFKTITCKNPANGVVFTTINNSNRTLCIEYTPTADYAGADSLCLLVCDNGNPQLCDTVRLPITVKPLPDAPSVSVTSLNIPTNTPLDTCFTIVDVDKNDTFTAALCGIGSGTAKARIQGNQLCINYLSANSFIGADTICATVCDAFGLCKTVNIPINVLPCSDIAAPKITCPANIEVNLSGVVVNDPDKIITSSTLADNCQGVVLNFKKPTATDDCVVKSVTQIEGITSGNSFAVGTQTITFEAKDMSEKASKCSFTVTVQPISLLKVDTASYCLNEIVTAVATLYPNATYEWKGPLFTSNYQALVFKMNIENLAGVYALSAKLSPTCTFKDTFVVKVLSAPTLEDDSYIIPINGELKDTVTHNDNISSAVFTANLKSDVANGTLTFKPDGTFTYKPATGFVGVDGFVYEICYSNCTSACKTATVSIKVANEKRSDNRATNVITPNGDGVNDALIIEGFDANANDNQSEITIFSQWGEKVYWASPYNNNWMGTFNSQPLPIGTYYFIFKKDPKATPITSFVTIVR